MMVFDFTITFGNVLTLLMFLGSVVVMFVRHRDAVSQIKSRCDLLEQAHDFLRQQLTDDRERSDKHWDDVKEMLNEISRKLDRKADKP